MIPNHNDFIQAIQDRKKVRVRFYSKAGNGMSEKVCAPLEYGPGGGVRDGLHRYWIWDQATLGLLPQQIVDLKTMGDELDAAQLPTATEGSSPAFPPKSNWPPVPVGSPTGSSL